MDNLTPITREEMLMNDEPMTPITREEKILAGEDLNPVTRREYFLKKYRHAGGDVMVEGLEVTANGTYTAPEGKAYSPVEVAVPLPDNAYLLKTASGSLVSFSDGADLPMPSFICKIEAVQSGSGDPSPENVRPISGHTGVDAWVRGKNLLPMTLNNLKAFNTSGTWTNNVYSFRGITFTIQTDNDGVVTEIVVNGTLENNRNVSYIELCYVKDFPFDSYIINGGYGNINSGVGVRAYKYNGTDNATSYGEDVSFTSTIDCENNTFDVFVSHHETINNIKVYPMVRPSIVIDSTFEPYNPQSQTIQVSWQTEAGEVYGGYVDLVSGELTVTHKSQTGFTRGGKDSSNKLYYIDMIADMKAFSEANNISPYYIDSMFEKMSLADARAAETPSITHHNKTLYVGGYIGKEAELDTLLETLQVKYELATPQTYQLTPQQIKSLLGKNNAWCDTGDVDIDYFARR